MFESEKFIDLKIEFWVLKNEFILDFESLIILLKIVHKKP